MQSIEAERGGIMSEVKLPLEFWCDDHGTEFYDPTPVRALERAYAELQERYNKMCEAHDRAESERLAAIGHQMQAEKDRDEAYAAFASARAAAADITKMHAREVYKLTKRAVNWEKSHAGQLQNTMAFVEDLERVTKERDEARAEVARLKAQLGDRCVGRWLDDIEAENKRLKRIEAAFRAHLESLGIGDGTYYSTLGDTLRKGLAGIGPDGEVKP